MVKNDKVPFVCSLMIKRKRMILVVLYHKRLKQSQRQQVLKKPKNLNNVIGVFLFYVEVSNGIKKIICVVFSLIALNH